MHDQGAASIGEVVNLLGWAINSELLRFQNKRVDAWTDIATVAAVARDLASTRPEVIIAVGAAAIRAIRDTGDRMPIVGAFIGEDPIAAGFAASLAHPGDTVTGIVMLAPELDGKRLHFLHEAFPDRHRIAALAVNEQRDAHNIAAVKDAAGHAVVLLRCKIGRLCFGLCGHAQRRGRWAANHFRP